MIGVFLNKTAFGIVTVNRSINKGFYLKKKDHFKKEGGKSPSDDFPSSFFV